MVDSHPLPPFNFDELTLPTTTTKKSDIFYRLNPANYSSAIFYDSSGFGRFDVRKELGILYLGKSVEAAFIETFGRELDIRFISRAFVKTRSLFAIKSGRPLHLVDLYGSGLAKLGADSDISSTRDYELSRSWCQAIYFHPQHVDGIFYMSRHDNTQLCCGLFNRKTYRLTENNLGNLLNHDRQGFFKILDRYGFGTG